MKMLLIALGVLMLTGCGSDGGENLAPYWGHWAATGRYCGQAASGYQCVQSVEPSACTGQQVFPQIVIQPVGDSVTIGADKKNVAIAGSVFTVAGGPTFEAKPFSSQSVVFKYTAGCEVEYYRRY